MSNIINGEFYKIKIKNLGEFNFLFSPNEDFDDEFGSDKYYMEVYWNPFNYGLADFIIGQYAEDVYETMNKHYNYMDYYIDCAKVACLCHLDNNTDTDGVYIDILNEYFDMDIEEIDIS